MKEIGREKTFVIVDLGFTDDEKKRLNQFRINRGDVYNRYGDINLLKEELPTSLRNIGENIDEDIDLVLRKVLETSKSFISATGKETAWITLRTSRQHSRFDIPRWHLDGRYFGKIKVPTLKLVSTLKGPSTLLSNSDQKDIRKIICDLNYDDEIRKMTQELKEIGKSDVKKLKMLRKSLEEYRLKNRKKIMKILNKESIVKMKSGDAAIYTTNNSEFGCIHSEPKITEDRIFFSVLPCTFEEMKELKMRHTKV